MPRALFRVSDKNQLAIFAQGLSELGWDLVASGGTAQALDPLPVVPVERVTGFPELLGGRVKTLHPAIHAGILAQDSQLDELSQQGFAPIDLVACNLYPFQQASQQDDLSLAEAIEQIDIGGVTLLRAAAKNFQRVTVLVDPADYSMVLQEIREKGEVSLATRQRLAIKAFAHTRDYDTAIHAYLNDLQDDPAEEGFSPRFSLSVHQTHELRYGENPHQQAGFFAQNAKTQPLYSELLAGKPLSYNNILDADAAWRAAAAFDAEKEAVVVIVKHLNPTGIAVGASPEAAYPFALESDPLSAFGGVIALNRPVNAAFVEALDTLFLEVIIAPDFEADAQEMLVKGRKNCRLLKINPHQRAPKTEFRSVLGGVLIQERDNGDPSENAWKVVTARQASEMEMETLRFAWKAVEHVKSNAIVLAHQGATVGIGGGLSSRIDAAQLAIEKAGKQAKGSVMASDAFFPFPDVIESAAAAGIRAIIQPGGAIRDQQVIEAANAADLAMIFTGIRHFRH